MRDSLSILFHFSPTLPGFISPSPPPPNARIAARKATFFDFLSFQARYCICDIFLRYTRSTTMLSTTFRTATRQAAQRQATVAVAAGRAAASTWANVPQGPPVSFSMAAFDEFWLNCVLLTSICAGCKCFSLMFCLPRWYLSCANDLVFFRLRQ